MLYVASVVSNSLQPYGLQPARLLCPRNFPGKNSGVGCHFLLQGIFLNQGWSPCLLCLVHWQMDSLPLAPPEKPTKVKVGKINPKLSSVWRMVGTRQRSSRPKGKEMVKLLGLSNRTWYWVWEMKKVSNPFLDSPKMCILEDLEMSTRERHDQSF